MKTNKEEIRKQYVDDIEFLKYLYFKASGKSYYGNRFNEEYLRQVYDKTRMFHIIAALQLLLSTESEETRQMVAPTIKEMQRVFEAMARIADATKDKTDAG